MPNMHHFHIPVMGTGFTIDTPLYVAKYGISSVISLVDDVLIEQMRKFHCERTNRPYEPITHLDKDVRAHRITAYLNLLDELVCEQLEAVRTSPFETNSETTRYYEMLPYTPLKQLYLDMLSEENLVKKAKLQTMLRNNITPGSIDVNIMTKLDSDRFFEGKPLPPEFSDASTALRGYAKSSLHSSVVLSAGFNPNLYNYIAQFDDFFPKNGDIKKKIILKVNDYRSAVIQGKYLAKHGIWVSEYRIESALNCGGHAFPNAGQLTGPILEEFKQKREQLIQILYEIYQQALAKYNIQLDTPPPVKVTFQGGIGTHEEHAFLLTFYRLDSTGWGTPFMLVPEAINLDEKHLQKLLTATEEDVYLSDSSPLGIPFWNLRTSDSEAARQERIYLGTPGSICPKKYVMNNSKFMPSAICPAAKAYQKRKLAELETQKLPKTLFEKLKEAILNKSCICHDLAGSVTVKHGIDPKATTAVCCGPNIINFSKIATLEEMISHIYGRISLITHSKRPHFFIKELMLNIEHLRHDMKNTLPELFTRSQKKFIEIKENLLQGIEYYQKLTKQLLQEQQESFIASLKQLQEELDSISFELASENS
jgi:hypothetical protein